MGNTVPRNSQSIDIHGDTTQETHDDTHEGDHTETQIPVKPIDEWTLSTTEEYVNSDQDTTSVMGEGTRISTFILSDV